MDKIEIIIKVIPMIASIMLGYYLTKAKILTDGMVDAFKKIVVNVTLPAGLFAAFINIDMQMKYLVVFASIYITCIILMYIGKLIAKVFSIKSKYFPLLLTGFEAGMMGYAIFTAVFGADAAADFGVVDIGQVSFVFTIFIPIIISMSGNTSVESKLKQSLDVAKKSPVIWAIVLGVAFSLMNVSRYDNTLAYSAVSDVFAFASAPTSFLICLVIGSGLKLTVKGLKMELITALLKVALAMTFAFVLAFAVFRPLGVESRIITALFALCCMPAPFAIPVFMDTSDEREVAYVSNTLSIGSIIGVLCFLAVIIIGL